MKLRNTLLGSTLLVAAFGSSALSLGRARGAVVLGQPLDLSVDVRLDQAEDAVGQCFDAEVFHADSRADANRVQVTVQNVTPALTATVRIRSSTIVDEPVVSVNLRSTCGQTTSRKYDFLTDFPVETRPSAVPTVIPAVVTTPASPAATSPVQAPAALEPSAAAPAPAASTFSPAPAPAPRAVAAPRPPRPVVTARPASPRPVRPREQAPRAASAPTPAPATASTPAPAPAATAPERTGPRLRLDAAAAPDDRQSQLKSSSELLSAPTDNAQQRADATAAWRSLNQLPPENPQAEKDRVRLQALEAEGKALRAQLAKNDEDMRLRLERLESNRFDSNIVYLLLALLLAALAAAAFFWNRARKTVAMVADWSRHNDPLVAEADAAALAAAGGAGAIAGRGVQSAAVPLEPEPVAPRGATRAMPASAQEDPDIDESLFQDLKKLKTVTLPQALAAASIPAALVPTASASASRGLSPEDFFDVQQHADFFVSLGQYDQAIDVLKKNIDENIEVSPLAYLELLKIYHTLSRQDDYNQLRGDFNRIFNGTVPPFAAFNDEGRGLEEYPAALRSIESHWGTPQVLDVIESNLYRTPGDATGPAFDLAAYREFLMLYAVAKSNVRRGAGDVDARTGRQSRSAPITFNTPLAPSAVAASVATPLTAKPAPAAPAAPSYATMMLDEPLPPEPVMGDGSHTQPMLLMPDTRLPELDLPPAVAEVPSYKQPLDLDLDLDLNLDFSNSELQAMDSPPPAGAVPELPMLDLPDAFSPTQPPEVEPPAGFPPATALDSNLIEFDLFDPTIEAKISPKNK
ncbi:MAG: hypothetical protein JWP29_4277 [Rhodoferax sp.]|nr:hypothetical protein [Rhodoferax sp.]